MNLVSKGQKSDAFSDDFIYKFDTIKTVEDVKQVIMQLKNSQHDITKYRITYIYDKDDFRPDDCYEQEEEFLQFYNLAPIDKIDNISFDSKVADRDASTTIYPESGLVSISIGKKMQLIKKLAFGIEINSNL